MQRKAPGFSTTGRNACGSSCLMVVMQRGDSRSAGGCVRPVADEAREQEAAAGQTVPGCGQAAWRDERHTDDFTTEHLGKVSSARVVVHSDRDFVDARKRMQDSTYPALQAPAALESGCSCPSGAGIPLRWQNVPAGYGSCTGCPVPASPHPDSAPRCKGSSFCPGPLP